MKNLSKNKIENELIKIGIALSAERDIPRLIEKILTEAMAVTAADGGTIYLISENSSVRKLDFSIFINKSLGIAKGGTTNQKIDLPGLIVLNKKTGEKNHKNVAAQVALTAESINIKNAYDTKNFDFSGTRDFDHRTGYISKSFLTVPLKSHEDRVIGVLQLINAIDEQTGEIIEFGKEIIPIIEALSSFAAVSLDQQLLLQNYKDLLEAIIKVIARAIDEKSPFTGGHCQRVLLLCEALAKLVCNIDQGPFKNFQMKPEEWFELHLAAWMHDCGKISTPDDVLGKATKLHFMDDKINEIEMRFQLLIKEKEIELLKQSLTSREGDIQIEHVLSKEIAEISNNFQFLKKCNKGHEQMLLEDQDRVKKIAQIKWHDHSGQEHDLLSKTEVDYLCINKATLTDSERKIIQNHIKTTIEMLELLPFPKYLKKVPLYAGVHHEMISGNGFPRGLFGDEIPIQGRIIALADIFEALTARDRPYKDNLKLSQAFRILQSMTSAGHIDKDLYNLFLTSDIWKTYADEYLLPEQRDMTNASMYLVE